MILDIIEMLAALGAVALFVAAIFMWALSISDLFQ